MCSRHAEPGAGHPDWLPRPSEPTIRAAALLDFLDLLESWSGEIDSAIYGPQHVEGRLAALHQVRVYVTALIEPEVAA